MEKVSVVIPVYNGERFIKEAVKTVLAQSYPEIEIVIVDDCSTDKTAEVIRENFQDLIGSKIIYHRNSKNMERAYSRNRGVELSSGDFVFFLDYDDLWSENHVENSLKHLTDHSVVYSFPRSFVNENSQVVRVSGKKIPPLGELIFSGQIGYPSATAVRKKDFIGYRDEYLIREDWEFFIRAYLEGLQIKVLDDNTVFMREHSGRTSRNLQFYKATLKVFNDYYGKIPAQSRPYFTFHTGEIALRFGDITLGWKLVLKALKQKPSLLGDKRKIFSALKRGVRIDRALRFSRSQ